MHIPFFVLINLLAQCTRSVQVQVWSLDLKGVIVADMCGIEPPVKLRLLSHFSFFQDERFYSNREIKLLVPILP